MRNVLLAAAVVLLSACTPRLSPWTSLEIGNPEVVRVIRNSDSDPPTVGVAAHRGSLRAVATQATGTGAPVKNLELRVGIENPEVQSCVAHTGGNTFKVAPGFRFDTVMPAHSPGAPELEIRFDLPAYIAGLCRQQPGYAFEGILVVNVSAYGTSGPVSRLAPVRLLVGR
jgi:hypothetical protein